MTRRLERSLRLHERVAHELADAAASVEPSRWFEPVAPGKWSAAQIVEHLNCTYDILLQELGGGTGMEIRTSRLTRALLWMTIVPRIVFLGRFPRRAPAPRETRPVASEPLGQTEAIEGFRARAEEVDRAVRAARPEQKITHAYFGAASLANGVVFCARHIQHHGAQLPRG